MSSPGVSGNPRHGRSSPHGGLVPDSTSGDSCHDPILLCFSLTPCVSSVCPHWITFPRCLNALAVNEGWLAFTKCRITSPHWGRPQQARGYSSENRVSGAGGCLSSFQIGPPPRPPGQSLSDSLPHFSSPENGD